MTTTLSYLRATGAASLRTAVALLLPLVPVFAADPGTQWGPFLSVGALGVVLSFATALLGVPDGEKLEWWGVALVRALRTFGQGIVAGLGTAGIATAADVAAFTGAWSSIAWGSILLASGVAALLTAVMAVLGDSDINAPAITAEEPTTPDPMDLSSPDEEDLLVQTDWSTIPDEEAPDGLVVSQNPEWEVTTHDDERKAGQ